MPVELALYFVACEALANVAKYAQATAASVRLTRAGDSVAIEIADDGVGGAQAARGSGLRGLQDRVEALSGPAARDQPGGRGNRRQRGAAVRVVIADDNLLMREGIASLVRRAGIEVAGEAGDADELLRAVDEHAPDAVIVDVRMPPTHTDEGLRAAHAIRAAPPAGWGS